MYDTLKPPLRSVFSFTLLCTGCHVHSLYEYFVSLWLISLLTVMFINDTSNIEAVIKLWHFESHDINKPELSNCDLQ